MLEVVLMKEYGWTWKELQETPSYIVDLAVEKMNADAQHQNQQQAKLKK